jgi:hypothetical protein
MCRNGIIWKLVSYFCHQTDLLTLLHFFRKQDFVALGGCNLIKKLVVFHTKRRYACFSKNVNIVNLICIIIAWLNWLHNFSHCQETVSVRRSLVK